MLNTLNCTYQSSNLLILNEASLGGREFVINACIKSTDTKTDIKIDGATRSISFLFYRIYWFLSFANAFWRVDRWNAFSQLQSCILSYIFYGTSLSLSQLLWTYFETDLTCPMEVLNAFADDSIDRQIDSNCDQINCRQP